MALIKVILKLYEKQYLKMQYLYAIFIIVIYGDITDSF